MVSILLYSDGVTVPVLAAAVAWYMNWRTLRSPEEGRNEILRCWHKCREESLKGQKNGFFWKASGFCRIEVFY